MDRRNLEMRPTVSLDASKLLGFSNLAKVVAGGEGSSVTELSRLLTKVGTEVPGPSNLPMGRLLSKISEIT